MKYHKNSYFIQDNMKIIHKFQESGKIEAVQDNTRTKRIEPRLTYKQARYKNSRQRRSEATIEPYNYEAHNGWMELDPITGEPAWHAPTVVSAEPLSEGQRMWRSPAFQLALAPMLDVPFILGNLGKTATVAKKVYTTPRVAITPVDASIGTSDPQFLGYIENILYPSRGLKSIESRFGESLLGKGLSLHTFQDTENPNLILKIVSGKYNTLEELQAAIDRELMSIKGLPLQEPFNVEGFIVNQGKLTPVFSQANLKSLNHLSVEDFNAKYGQLIADKLAPYGYKVVSDPGKPLIFSNGKSRLTSFVPQNAGLNADGELRFFDVARDNIINPQDNIINWLMQLKSTDPQQYEIMSQTLGIKIPDIF